VSVDCVRRREGDEERGRRTDLSSGVLEVLLPGFVALVSAGHFCVEFLFFKPREFVGFEGVDRNFVGVVVGRGKMCRWRRLKVHYGV
jgi:hypothetical protein